MKRRSFLKFLGLTPVAVPVIAADVHKQTDGTFLVVDTTPVFSTGSTSIHYQLGGWTCDVAGCQEMAAFSSGKSYCHKHESEHRYGIGYFSK